MHSRTMVQRETVGTDRPRSAPRHKIFQPTQLLMAAGEARAHLINISLSGALVHVMPTPRRGEMVQVVLDGVPIAGQVRWTDGPRFGMVFSSAIEPTLLDRLLGDS